MKGPCMCGSPDCPSCGGAMGTYGADKPPDIADLAEWLRASTDHLKSALYGTLNKELARECIAVSESLLGEFSLCTECNKRYSTSYDEVCEQCGEALAEREYEKYQSEAFRGTEAEAYNAEEQERIQRELKR